MPDDNTTSDQPQAQPFQSAPSSEPEPQPDTWPNIMKPETRGGDRNGFEHK